MNRLVLAFRNLSTGQVVELPQLTKDRPYHVVGARSVHGQYGPTVLSTLRSEEDDNIILIICLPGGTPKSSMMMSSTISTWGGEGIN